MPIMCGPRYVLARAFMGLLRYQPDIGHSLGSLCGWFNQGQC